MKLFYSQIGSRIININGRDVKFVNCIAEVDNEFGLDALKLGLPGLYENGKQPAFETPKEVKMMSDFKDKEDFFQKEISRLKNIIESKDQKIKGLEADLQNWKNEYLKEHNAFLKFVDDSNKGAIEGSKEGDSQQAPSEASDSVVGSEKGEQEESGSSNVDDELRKELLDMKKDELLSLAEKDCGMNPSELKGLKKDEIIDRIIEASK